MLQLNIIWKLILFYIILASFIRFVFIKGSFIEEPMFIYFIASEYRLVYIYDGAIVIYPLHLHNLINIMNSLVQFSNIILSLYIIILNMICDMLLLYIIMYNVHYKVIISHCQIDVSVSLYQRDSLCILRRRVIACWGDVDGSSRWLKYLRFKSCEAHGLRGA